MVSGPGQKASAILLAFSGIPREAITGAVSEGIYRWLMEHAGDDGAIDYPTERWYGWVLWDVRDRVDRDYGV